MNEAPVLNDEEWELILEMLRHERDDLRVEIHHAVPAAREELQAQLVKLDGLIGRLQGAMAG